MGFAIPANAGQVLGEYDGVEAVVAVCPPQWPLMTMWQAQCGRILDWGGRDFGNDGW